MKPDEFETYLKMEELSEALRNAAADGDAPRPLTEKPVYRPNGCVALLAAASLAAWVALVVGLYLLVRWIGWVAVPLIFFGSIAAGIAAASARR